MMKIFCFLCLLIILQACTEALVSDITNEDINYTGNNKVGKILVEKIKEREGGEEEWDRIKKEKGEPLLDYALFGYGTKYGLHYIVPIKSLKNNIIESYLVYEVKNVDSDDLSSSIYLEAPLVFDQKQLESIPETHRFLYSSFFLNWKKEGLAVRKELYEFSESLNGKVRSIENDDSSLITKSGRSDQYHVNVDYWIDLHGYLPGGVHAYAYSLASRKSLFEGKIDVLIQNIPTFAGYRMEVTLKSISMDLVAKDMSRQLLHLPIHKYLYECKTSLFMDPGESDSQL